MPELKPYLRQVVVVIGRTRLINTEYMRPLEISRDEVGSLVSCPRGVIFRQYGVQLR